MNSVLKVTLKITFCFNITLARYSNGKLIDSLLLGLISKLTSVTKTLDHCDGS